MTLCVFHIDHDVAPLKRACSVGNVPGRGDVFHIDHDVAPLKRVRWLQDMLGHHMSSTSTTMWPH